MWGWERGQQSAWCVLGWHWGWCDWSGVSEGVLERKTERLWCGCVWQEDWVMCQSSTLGFDDSISSLCIYSKVGNILQRWVLAGHCLPSLQLGIQVFQIALAKSLFMIVLPSPLLESPFHLELKKKKLSRMLILWRYMAFKKHYRFFLKHKHMSFSYAVESEWI